MGKSFAHSVWIPTETISQYLHFSTIRYTKCKEKCANIGKISVQRLSVDLSKLLLSHLLYQRFSLLKPKVDFHFDTNAWGQIEENSSSHIASHWCVVANWPIKGVPLAVLGSRSFIMRRKTVYPRIRVILKEDRSTLCGGK